MRKREKRERKKQDRGIVDFMMVTKPLETDCHNGFLSISMIYLVGK